MTFEELSSEALIANMHYHRALAEKAMEEGRFHLERFKIFEDEMKKRTEDVVKINS